jgi:uncharacterized protein DUF1206
VPDLSQAPATLHTASESVHRAGNAATGATKTPWIQGLMRLGYIARGLVYLVPGVLALRLAIGTHGAMITQTETIGVIGRQPLGRLLLIPVAVGLAGYALWGMVRAVLDPLRKGHSVRGIMERLGYAMSGLAYAGLLAATVRFLASAARHTAKDRDWAAELLAKPSGAWLLGIVGLCWIAGAGVLQISEGWRGSFKDDLALERMGSGERRWAARLGHVGIVARGVVFSIIGMLLVAAALHANPHMESGLDGAMLELTRHPFGRILLAAVAMGLIAFGVFSVMCARWMRMGATAHASGSRSFPSSSV